LLCGSINARERPWASKRQPIDYKRCCTDRLNAQMDTGHWTTSLYRVGTRGPLNPPAIRVCSSLAA
jgi:hypothetical protein